MAYSVSRPKIYLNGVVRNGHKILKEKPTSDAHLIRIVNEIWNNLTEHTLKMLGACISKWFVDEFSCNKKLNVFDFHHVLT